MSSSQKRGLVWWGVATACAMGALVGCADASTSGDGLAGFAPCVLSGCVEPDDLDELGDQDDAPMDDAPSEPDDDTPDPPDDDPDDVPPEDDPQEPPPDDEEDEQDPAQDGFMLGVTALRVVLGYAEVGQTPSAGELLLLEYGGRGSEGGVEISVLEGDFEVTGEQGAMEAGEERRLEVHYNGAASEPGLAAGLIRVGVDGQEVTVEVSAVIGDPALPAQVSWEHNDYGSLAFVQMPSAPYPYPADGPWDDSTVMVFVPDGFSDRGPVNVVAHMHGLRSVIERTAGRQWLMEQHALSGRDAIFIAPQGPLSAGSNEFGKLDEPGGFARLVEDVLTLLYREGRSTGAAIGDVVITAHSGGYKPTSRLIDHGGLPISAVHLFDALYGQEASYQRFVTGGGMLRSSYIAGGGTSANNLALIDYLEARGVPVATQMTQQTMLDNAVLIHPTAFTHNGCVRGDRSYEQWLRTSGLPRSPLTAPTILAALHDGDQAHIIWQEDASAQAMEVRVEGSEDGQNWQTLATTTGTEASVPAMAWYRLLAVDSSLGASQASNRYGATGSRWLIVDGFERRLGGSWTIPTHGFAAALGQSLGEPFSVASAEAVSAGLVSLDDYPRVLWMLGDESRDDVTFDERQKVAIEDYIDGGGRLLVTGSEVGYATAPAFLSGVLNTRYIRDNAGTDVAQGYTFGVTYEEDYPDVLGGTEVIWRYDTGGAAAVGHEHRTVVVGFALETLGDAERAAALGELSDWLDGP